MKEKFVVWSIIVSMVFSLFLTGCNQSTGTKPESKPEVKNEEAKKEEPKKETVQFPKEKPIKLIIPYGAGGGVDIAARILASTAPEILDQRIDVICMAGAGGQEAINFVMKQPADGYTLLVTDYGPLVTTALSEGVNYDLSDWTPIAEITQVIPTFFTKSDSPIKSVEDWVKAAKEKPGSISVAHGRNLSVPHLPLIMFDNLAGIKNTHVPTTGGSEALAFVLGKKVDIGASVPSTIAGSVKSGDVRALAVASDERAPSLKDVPTMKELGYDVSLPAWYTIFAYKGVPDEELKLLQDKFIEALNSESAKGMAKQSSVDLTPKGMEECKKIYNNTINNLKGILANIKK